MRRFAPLDQKIYPAHGSVGNQLTGGIFMQLSPEAVKNNLFSVISDMAAAHGFSQLRKQLFPVNEKSLLRIRSSPFYLWKSFLQNMKCSSILISAQSHHLSLRLSNSVQNYLPKPFRSFSVILQILLILAKP